LLRLNEAIFFFYFTSTNTALTTRLNK
jgi:hypothetical protein